ncbi:MAG: hypothetical protein F7C35_08265 [Desulfurococcales archaeon]|nr:hypothetical protein [Desulfurococcales archaeon]
MEWKEYNKWIAALAIDRFLAFRSKGVKEGDARAKALAWIESHDLDPLSYARYKMLKGMIQNRVDSYLAFIDKSRVRLDKRAIAVVASLLAGVAAGFFLLFPLWG